MDNYYEKNAKKYIEETIDCDMKMQYDFFLKYMPNKGKILDIGFGSGRDMMYFASIGYDVEGIDPTLSFVNHMKEKGYKVYPLTAEELKVENEFEGIWACASLLHVNRADLLDTLNNCKRALKVNGIMYCSFKYGNGEIINNERYFNYLNEESLKEFSNNDSFKIIDIKKSNDVRKDRSCEQWINIIFKRMQQ